MLSPDELGELGKGEAGAARVLADRALELVVARLAESVAPADLARAVADSGQIPALVLSALGGSAGKGALSAAGEVHRALSESARRDVAALGSMAPESAPRMPSTREALASLIGDFARRRNLSMAADARESYREIVSDVIPRVNAGLLGREQAVAEAVRRMAERGICSVDYASGRREQPDVAVRRHIQTLAKRQATEYTESLCRRAGIRLVEVDSHVGARPSHRRWQGRVYGLDGPVEVGGVRYPGLAESGAADGLREPNCLHSMAPYVPGAERRWSPTPDGDAGLDPERAYRALQAQRANERKIRAAKREAAALREAGADDTAARLRLGRAQAAQRRLLKENPGLVRRPERERAYGKGGGPVAVQPLSRSPKTVRTAIDEARERIKAKGASARRVEELLASTPGFKTMDAAGQKRAVNHAINLAAAEKKRDERARKTELNGLKVAKQRGHIKGTKEYAERIPGSVKRGYAAPSAMTVSIEECQKLVYEFAGKGVPGLTKAGNWTGTETCDAGRMIGEVVFSSELGKPPAQTSRFKITYAGKGTHVVPVYIEGGA